ncbi:PilN domain-containing protein [Pseudomonas hunanensis]|uniref:PilN domain-containing protein n=1 Tax=Pseudomonas TaxID=286 RepID=UPI001AE466C7|nr:PilN domain-containing protein [Pseudomonas hunanensis]HDS1734234.1 PilN domain-containing protein [Pseudomonas putida]
MLRLNLLPWRERDRLAALRRFQRALIGSLLLAFCGVMVLDYLARQRAHLQAAAIVEGKARIASLDKQLEEVDGLHHAHQVVTAQLASLEALRSDQGQAQSVFAALERALGTGLQLTELSLQEGQLQLLGLAASPAVVAQFMRDLQHAQLFETLELKHIRSGPEGDAFLLLARVMVVSR